MKNKFFRTFAVTLAAVLCFTAFSGLFHHRLCRGR